MPKTLLLADDSVVIQKLVGLSFANEDVTIVATDNGDDAVARAREITPDVVLADVVMPGLSGYEVCEAIKREPALAHVPVLLLTGTFEAFDEARATQAGANGHITKPFEAQALVQRVTEVMRSAERAPRPAPGAASAATTGTTAGTTAGNAASDDFDFFDNDLTALASPDTTARQTEAARQDASSSLDVTPSIDADAEVGDGLDADALSGGNFFGDPGEAEADPFETVGTMALGESLSGEAAGARPSAKTAVTPPTAAAPAPKALPDPTPLAADDFDSDDFGVGAVELETDDDPLADLSADLDGDDPLGLDEAMSASSFDLDMGLDDAERDEPGEATVYVPPPLPPAAAPRPPAVPTAAPVATPAEAVRVHAPTTGIASDAATARVPLAPPAATPEPDSDFAFGSSASPVVTDLDADLAANTSDGPAAMPPASDFALDPATSVGAPTRAFELPTAPERIDLGPTSVSSEDLDFAFDVSEQVPVDEAGDPLGDSFASFADLVSPESSFDPLQAPVGDAPTVVADYDVSSGDLAEASAQPVLPVVAAAPRPTPMATPNALREPEPVTIDEAEDAQEAEPAFAAPPPQDRIAPATSEPLDLDVSDEFEEPDAFGADTPSEPVETGRISDLSPVMEQRIHETLEKVAWEAFSDLSETIVKQVLARVEQIAWEVIPEMAETLVREEIRRMKGDED
ncbi:MAG: response regulator [Myxococcota bacterium]